MMIVFNYVVLIIDKSYWFLHDKVKVSYSIKGITYKKKTKILISEYC